MRCEEALELISARLDGEAAEHEKEKLEAHLAVCPACRALAEDLSAQRLSLRELEEVPAPEGFARGVMDRVRALERERKAVPLFRRPQVRALAGLAACAAVCIGLYAASRARQARWETMTQTVRSAASVAGEAAPEEPEALFRARAEDGAAADSGAGSWNAGETESVQAAGAAPAALQDEKAAYSPPEWLSKGGAVLTLSALPEGAEEILPPDAPCSAGPEAVRTTGYTVSREQFEALAAMAEGQGLVLERTEGNGSFWTVVVQP